MHRPTAVSRPTTVQYKRVPTQADQLALRTPHTIAHPTPFK